MGRRLISLMAALAIGTMGALALAAPGNASTTSTFTLCNAPEQEVPTLDAAKAVVKDINPAACLDIQFTDKCDGTTVVTMTNWAFNDNKFTVLTVKLDGKEYTLKGGSDPNTETVVLGPKVEDLQAILVFRFNGPGDTTWTVEKPYGDPWTWEEPKACVSPSPSPSVSPSVSPSPSPSVSTSTTGPLYANCDAAVAAGVAPLHRGDAGYSADLDGDGDGVACETPPAAAPNDLPVTGASLGLPLGLGTGLVAVAVIGSFLFVAIKRRRDEISE